MTQNKATPLYGPFAKARFRPQLPNFGPYGRGGEEHRWGRKLTPSDGPERGVALFCDIANNFQGEKGAYFLRLRAQKATQPVIKIGTIQ